MTARAFRWLTLALGVALLAYALAGCRPTPPASAQAAPADSIPLGFCEYNGTRHPAAWCDSLMAEEVAAQAQYIDEDE